MELAKVKTALAHHWFLNVSGGERVCSAIYDTLNNPDIFCILGRKEGLPLNMRCVELRQSFIHRLPRAERDHRYYAALFPLAVESLDLHDYDLVVSSDSAAMKGIITRPDTCHICYCHSPMRYAWSMAREYMRGHGILMRGILSLVMHYLRMWDQSASSRVDYFACNSKTVKERIWKYYRREATIIYPPCDVDAVNVSLHDDGYYLFVGRLVGYKRADLAVKSFSRSGRRLVVVGNGPQERALKSIASRNIEFLGWVGDQELRSLYAQCSAVVFPGEEDFGIVPVEAQACGKPVIAYGRGGATETVIPGKTGLWFEEQTVDALESAVSQFERAAESFDPHFIRSHAEKFNEARFKQEFRAFTESCLENHRQFWVGNG